MQVLDALIASRSAIRPQVVRDQALRNEGIFLQKLAHQFQSGVLVALGLDQHVEDLALGVDGAPQINHPPIDFQIDFVKMPGGMWLRAALPKVLAIIGPKWFTQQRTVSETATPRSASKSSTSR
jgi:hypothetical protein